LNGYRLSGADMSNWAGQRVQVTGTMTPAAGIRSGTTPAMPEFRVQSVQPMPGTCPPQ
jgi:hypothetical protein